ncbi:DUF6229 family protein [Nonomuraea sp. NPDC049480]|uniref:DUF6229 family protein n=1 Tax=Nonomuraea sp. NPDC049480 TaxID=3364353 RepID=UPI003795D5F0
MPTLTLNQAETIVAGWRTGAEPVAGWKSPAGPLFPSGEYAEADISATITAGVSICGTACTWSCLQSSRVRLACC